MSLVVSLAVSPGLSATTHFRWVNGEGVLACWHAGMARVRINYLFVIRMLRISYFATQ